jgi:TIR domain
VAEIFLSYRRSDAPSATGRLADTLAASFGAGRVFRDLLAIEPGHDFEAALQRAVGGARVLIAVVGPGWLDARDAAGRRRLDDPADMVRREIESALQAGVPVVPVLVEGARMPAADALPAALQAFARCQAVPLDDTRWADDTRRLAQALRQQHGVEPSGPGADAAAGAPLRGVVLDLVELLVLPRRLLLRRVGSGGSDDLLRAGLLFLLCLVLGNLLVGGPLEMPLASWVLSGTLLGLVWGPALAALVVAAWRLGGAGAGWQRLATGSLCIVGGAWVHATAGLAVFALGIALSDRSVLPGVLAAARAGLPTMAEIEALVTRGVQGPALAAIVVSTLLWLAGVAWVLAAWRAMRHALLRPWWVGLAAGALLAGMLTALVLAAAWAAAPA